MKKLLPKKPWLRRTLIAAAALLSAPFIVSGGLWLWLDQDDYKARLSAAVEARTGRPLIVGDLRVALGWTPRLYAEDIRYPNPDWASSPYAIEIKRAVFAVDLFALFDLFGGKLLLRDVMLEAPVLKFERNADGAHNFALKKRERKSKPPMDVTLTEAAIVDGAITIQTRNREWNIVIDGARAHAHAGAPVTLAARGSVEEVAVDASATFAELKTLLAGAPSPVSVTGVVGGEKNFVTADGDAKNLFKWSGVNLNLNFDIARLDAWSKFYRADATLPAIAFTGGAKLNQPARLGTLALGDIDFISQHGGLTTRLTGGIKRAFYRDGFDLAVATDGRLTPAWLSAWPAWVVGVGGGDSGGIVTTAAGAVTGSSRDLQLTVTDAVATAGGLTATAAGTVAVVDGRWQGGLPVSFELTVDAADAPAWLPSPSSPLTATASLLRKQGRWHLHDLAMDAAADASIAVTGGIHDLTGAPSATLAVAVTADDLPTPAGVPPLTDLAVTADLAFGDGAPSAAVSAASANLGGVALTATGEIRNLGNDIADTVDAELEVTATLADAAALTLTPPATALLGALTPLTGTALVTAAAGDWRVDDLRIASDADGLAAASLTGGVGFAPLDAKLRLHADGVKVADLPAAWRIPRPDGGVVNAKATLTARGDGSGGVAVGAHGIDLHLTAPSVVAEAHGDIDRWRPLAVNNLTAALTADSVGALNWPAASRWQPGNAVKATLTLAAGGARRTDAEFEAVVGDNDLRGRVNWRRGDDDTAPPRVEAELIAARIELTEIFKKPPKREKVDDADDTPTPLSATPFNTDWLRRLDGRLHLVAGEAGGRWFSVNDLRVQADAGGGVLRNTVAAKMGDGDLALSVKLDASDDGDDGDGVAGNGDGAAGNGDDGDAAAPLSASLNLRAAGLATDGLRAFRRREFLQGGTLAADIKVAAAGASMRDLAEAADGHLRLRLDRARIKNQALDIFGGDLFTNLVTAINPFRSLGEFVEVECAMVTLAVGGGVAGGEDALAVKTDQVTLLGGGEVRLADGELDFLFSPKARKGLGINPSSIAKIVRLGGSVGAPRIVADPGGLVETGVVAWATAVTGGLALLAKGLLDRNRANADICGNGGGGAPVRDAREG